jgi:hypothetical protein
MEYSKNFEITENGVVEVEDMMFLMNKAWEELEQYLPKSKPYIEDVCKINVEEKAVT